MNDAINSGCLRCLEQNRGGVGIRRFEALAGLLDRDRCEMDHRAAAVECRLHHRRIADVANPRLDRDVTEPRERLRRVAYHSPHTPAGFHQLAAKMRSDQTGGPGNEHRSVMRVRKRKWLLFDGGSGVGIRFVGKELETAGVRHGRRVLRARWWSR